MARNSYVCAFVLLLGVAIMGLWGCATSGAPAVKGGKGCLDCHQDYRQRFGAGTVHAPVSKGECGGCHRTHGLIGGAFLVTEMPQLCYSCHGKMVDELKAKPVVHDPVQKGNCVGCHLPHNGAEKGLLKQHKDQICFSCHDRKDFERKFVHAPVGKGCGTCHENHGAAFPSLLKKEVDTLCKDCHAPSGGNFLAAHGGYTPQKRCVGCHNVHSGNTAKLLKDSVHKPVANRECGKCHQPVSSANPFAAAKVESALCFGCHSDKKQEFSVDGAHPPARNGECGTCHDPHASNHAGMVKMSPLSLCGGCHKFKFVNAKKEEIVQGAVHDPAGKGNCLSCHAPHVSGAGAGKLLRKAGNATCRDCHEGNFKSQTVRHEPSAKGNCLGCHLPHESSEKGLLKQDQRPLCSGCHTKISDDLAASSVHRPFAGGQCSGCHDAHGSSRKGLMRGDGSQVCATCHEQVKAEMQKPRRHDPFKKGQCGLCHRPHSSQEAFLLAAPAKDLCVKCHPGRVPVEGTPSAHQNCAVCHHAHGNDEPAYLLKGRPGLCVGCHDVNRYWTKGKAHKPASEGKCGACHDPHAPHKGKEVLGSSRLCGSCHDVSPAALQAKHQGIRPGDQSCLSCHDPHGSQDKGLIHPVKHSPFAQGDCKACHTGGKR